MHPRQANRSDAHGVIQQRNGKRNGSSKLLHFVIYMHNIKYKCTCSKGGKKKKKHTLGPWKLGIFL